jgi:hypothetical protein
MWRMGFESWLPVHAVQHIGQRMSHLFDEQCVIMADEASSRSSPPQR